MVLRDALVSRLLFVRRQLLGVLCRHVQLQRRRVHQSGDDLQYVPRKHLFGNCFRLVHCVPGRFGVERRLFELHHLSRRNVCGCRHVFVVSRRHVQRESRFGELHAVRRRHVL